MQIWVSKPYGSGLGGLEEALHRRWRMAAKYAQADVHFIEANRGEIHGELMERLWMTKILPHEDPIHIVSESDFLPYRTALSRLARDAGDPRLKLRLNLIGCPYVTRVYAPGESPSRSPGKLTAHSNGEFPLLAPWFLYLDLRDPAARRLPDNWLGAAGPFNDAANLGLFHAHEAGFITSGPNRNWGLLTTRDAWPAIHGARYPRVGIHAFFARALDADQDEAICWEDRPGPLLAGDHHRNLRALLR